MSKPIHLCCNCLLGLRILLILEVRTEILNSSFVQLQGLLIVASIILCDSLFDEVCKQVSTPQCPRCYQLLSSSQGAKLAYRLLLEVAIHCPLPPSLALQAWTQVPVPVLTVSCWTNDRKSCLRSTSTLCL